LAEKVPKIGKVPQTRDSEREKRWTHSPQTTKPCHRPPNVNPPSTFNT
jgi:hypothetical protein